MKEITFQMREKKNTRCFVAVLIAVTVVVVCICTFFVYQIKQTTAAETERYLSELSASVVYSVDARLQANLDALDSIALTYVERKRLGLEEDLSYLQEKAEVHKFVSVFVMSMDGMARGSDGAVHNFSGIPQIMETLAGQKNVMNDALLYGETKNGFAYSVPIYEEDQITGALVACNTTEWIKSLLSQSYFEGEGFFHIIDDDGAFIVKSNNPYTMKENKNFFNGLEKEAHFNYNSSLDELKKYVATDQMGTIYFTIEASDISRIGKVIPLSYSGYYLFLVVNESAASRQFDALLLKSIMSNVIISLLFASLAVIIFVINNRHKKQLSDLAFVDPVTGGYSQVRFETEAERLIKAGHAGAYTFVSLNVANFKLVNDSFGDAAGDQILKYIHDVVKSNLRTDELICRSFSDNFDLLIKNRSQEEFLADIGQITNKINAFNNESSEKYYLLLTVGVYRIEDQELSIVHIRDRANVARKGSKNVMGNELYACTFYSELERQKQLRNKDLENRMNDALKRGEFEVFFQPKIRLEDREIAGAEALVRWRDRERGLLPPIEFIPFFEQNHFIIQIDLYVFEKVCQYIRCWLDEGLKPVPVSVNLSRVHLKDKNFLQKFKTIQEKYNVPSSLLEMELTETVLSENLEMVTDVIEQIHQMGISCSIDDFGSGYSSLNLLKTIQADALKLDKAFFDTPETDNLRGKVIIETVLGMAKKLQMTIVAEGVETVEQMQYLNEIKCDMVQGYVFSKPVEASVFEKLVFGEKKPCDAL